MIINQEAFYQPDLDMFRYPVTLWLTGPQLDRLGEEDRLVDVVIVERNNQLEADDLPPAETP